MSSYSELLLAANDGVRSPTRAAVGRLLEAAGVIDPGQAMADEWELSEAVRAPFFDPATRAENDQFFLPGLVSLNDEIYVSSPTDDDSYEGPAWAVSLHGYGYTSPWELADLRDRVTRLPELVRLRAALVAEFGGRFVMPPGHERMLRTRLVDGADGWVWLLSDAYP